jgi:hypothetical protein
MRLLLCAVCCTTSLAAFGVDQHSGEYGRRVQVVTHMPGFIALWDFVKREAGTSGRFTAYQKSGDRFDFSLDAVNYVRDYWGEGREASYADFPLLGRGPFGQAIRIQQEQQADFRPCLLVPRAQLHDSGLDVKGPGRSVTLVAWVIRESGNHAIAGIWHEGTDLQNVAPAKLVEPGMRQYAIFAGLAANPGASAAHVSENGGRSFGDRYARNLAVTPQVIPAVHAAAPASALDHAWTLVGFAFDNRRNTVTAYFNGEATELWIDHPESHPFYQWPYRAYVQAQLHRLPGLQTGENPDFPPDQFYEPPEGKPRRRTILERSSGQQIELHEFEFTKVRVTLRWPPGGKPLEVVSRQLMALKANPFWFAHDLYAPPTVAAGGPFTIGRVIHSSRSVGFTGYIGGVAVFSQALSRGQMRRLADLGRTPLNGDDLRTLP